MKAAVVFAALLLLAVDAAGQRAPRTAWGHPDLRGTWTKVTATPLERPRDLAGRSTLTEDERAERFRQFTLETSTDTVPRAGSTGSHNEYWRERGVLLRRTSLLVDPPDGRLPPLTPEGQKVRDRLRAAWTTAPADGPDSRDLFERCITRGLPGTMMGNFYNHNYEILQTPDHVVSALRVRLPRGQLRPDGHPGRPSRRGARRRGGPSAVTSDLPDREHARGSAGRRGQVEVQLSEWRAATPR